jgi:hypothetical protein
MSSFRGLMVVACALLHACGPGAPAGDPHRAHVRRLRHRLGAELTVVDARPFAVIGNAAPQRVREVARDVVATTVRLLKQDFFDRDAATTNVWILRDARTYRATARRLFHQDPSTPYGFYRPDRRTMVMNLDTGLGTLVHELVHPFMERNLPGCPPWFNEGFASLFERSDVRDEHLVGLINWRLPGLKQEIAWGTLPSFAELMQLPDERFYRNARGDNYAQARYLLYYLQERGLLRIYLWELRKNLARDPTGLATLQRVLGEPDLAQWETTWRAWVMAL